MLALGNWVKAVQELSGIFTFLEVLTLPQNEKLWGNTIPMDTLCAKSIPR